MSYVYIVYFKDGNNNKNKEQKKNEYKSQQFNFITVDGVGKHWSSLYPEDDFDY